MNNELTSTVFKHLIQCLDINFISYVGSAPSKETLCPEEFARGYHKCIEDLINEAKQIGFTTTAPVPSNTATRQS